jgi:hypothetical protein
MKTKKVIKIKKYPEGTSSVSSKKEVSRISKPLDTYNRETTTTYETKPGVKGKLYITKGTVQRNSIGKGVDFKPEGTEERKNNKIVDPKSRALESTSQATLRQATQEVHKDVDLSKRYKEGDYVTYNTKKGSQVAGRVDKTPDIPAEYETETKREVQVSRKGDTKDSGGRSTLGKQYESQGYKNIPGTYKYTKADEHKFVPEDQVDAHIKQGYYRSDRVKSELDKKKNGVKKIKVFKKK